MKIYPSSVLLLSGGMDSAALAAITRPALTLFVNYGHRPALAESRAAAAVSAALGIPHEEVVLDLGPLGGGLLLGDDPLPEAPSPEWWPYRNQFLATAGAARALQQNLDVVLLGSVLGDGERHVDGRDTFYAALDTLVSMQEGGVRIVAPALATSTEDLIGLSGLGMDILGWTVSCHRGDLPCFACPGCYKRERVLRALGELQTDGE
jgi:7-cyano-7-deazaguanine synthase